MPGKRAFEKTTIPRSRCSQADMSDCEIYCPHKRARNFRAAGQNPWRPKRDRAHPDKSSTPGSFIPAPPALCLYFPSKEKCHGVNQNELCKLGKSSPKIHHVLFLLPTAVLIGPPAPIGRVGPNPTRENGRRRSIKAGWCQAAQHTRKGVITGRVWTRRVPARKKADILRKCLIDKIIRRGCDGVGSQYPGQRIQKNTADTKE